MAHLHLRKGQSEAKTCAAFGMLLCMTVLVSGCSILDQHRTVTKMMGWQCIGSANQPGRQIESVKLWFLDNPRYEERASGQKVCSELAASGQHNAAVTFDVWGNSLKGLHGYNMTAIAVRGRQLQVTGIEGGGYHDDSTHIGTFSSAADEKLHPELYRFPLDVFR